MRACTLARAGGLAVAFYALSSQFVFFNSQFAYQTLALPLALAAVSFIADASALLVRRESIILDACNRPGFSTADIRAAFKTMEDIS